MKQHYALTNPISMILDKPAEDFTRADLIRVIEEKNIERITFHYTALDGKLKELKLPIVSKAQAERVLADGERVDGSSLFKGMVDASVSDLYVVPLYKTAFLNPFEPGSLDLVCRYLTADGERAPYAMDNILHNAAKLFTKTTGLEFYAMGELEFFLIGDQTSNIFPGDRQRGYHASAPFVKSGRVLDEMVRAIAQMTGAVKYAHSEVGLVEHVRSDLDEIHGKRAEQLEIEFLPTPVVEAGSHLVLARWLIRNIAYKYGYVATFAPKIEEGVAGNGFHVHMALMKDGKNVMTGKDGALTDPARQVIGGLCKHAGSLTAFGNTVSSAYLRLVPDQEAPTRICWSDLNRSAMIRVPLGWANANNLARSLNPAQGDDLESARQGRQTVELRCPDGSAIIHLLLAGITMAAQWGLTNPESLKTAEELYAHGNVFKNQELLDSLPALPASCVASARRLEEDRALYEREGIFPAGMIDYMVKTLLAERDLKMNQRLADLPADDRLHETRRIMHAVLHRH